MTGEAVMDSRTRVERLRRKIIEAPQEVCAERAMYFTRSMSEHWDEHPLSRMSKALAFVLDNISVIIRDDELIVGCRTTKLKGAPLFPENKATWIEGDLDSFEIRVLQRALITEEEKRILREEVLPFWKGRTVEEHLDDLLPDDVVEDMDKYVFTMMLEITYGIGHFTMDHGRVLRDGLRGIIDEVWHRLETSEGEKALLYEAMIRSMEAAIRFAHRYADAAERMADSESEPVRAEELREVARVCRRVPENPAQSLQEAVQSVYFIHLISQLESGGNSISLGRIDQLLYPFYKADLDAGRVTPEKARELIALLFIKTNEIWNVLEEAFIPGGEGTEGKTTQNVTVGGIGVDGEDATNELSYIGLDAYADVRTAQPNFGVRLGSKAPRDLFVKAAAYSRDGVLMHFFNDDVIVESLLLAGLTLEDARDYGVVGCLEPSAQGKTFGSTFAVQFNGIKCLEFALSNGIDNVFGYQSGLKTGDPAEFKSFDEVWNAYSEQVAYFVKQVAKGMEALDHAIADMVPSPFASAMIQGPMEKGIDLTLGGAVYNSTGVQFMGFANTADSLYSVKKAVFDEGKVAIADLVTWLAEDWMDAEDMQSYFLRKLPKFGNDVDEVDEMAARVVVQYADELAKYKNFRAATPDGRFAGDVLGNGLTPTTGNAISGATAVMNSVTKLPLERLYNGANLNMRFAGAVVNPDVLVDLVKAYFEKGGFQVQFNMVDSSEMVDAQAHPGAHRDLVVRVSGYSAQFIDLSDTAQDEIISRTEFEMAR
jgi:pyruvate formate-lyase/glycerol dehydratase family glycyl radical enzyme